MSIDVELEASIGESSKSERPRLTLVVGSQSHRSQQLCSHDTWMREDARD